MSGSKTAAVKVAQLNRMNPAARDADLGDVVADLITALNALHADLTALRAKYNAALAKLDADAGVTGTDYVATQAAAALTATTVADLAAR